jgi:hypothetical protein
MMESTDRISERDLVRICRACAQDAIEILDEEAKRRGESLAND